MKKMGNWLILIVTLTAFLGIPNISIGAKTFTCTGGTFKKDVDEYYGECVLYVRYETGINHAGCNGAAWTCLKDAQDNGYATGSEPRESAIVVFGKNPNVDGDVGHVGIVIVGSDDSITIRDSNWSDDLDGKVRQHIMKINDSNHPILGYIYCDGKTNTPYTYSSHAYTGTGEVQGGADTNYNYSLPTRKSEFTMGETAKAMVRVENITVKHRWLVEIWQAGKKKSDYA